LKRLFALLILALSISAFGAGQQNMANVEARNSDYVILDLLGYNYTDRNIEDYSVNGQGGGDIRLSSPSSGGSGIVCCVKLLNGRTNPVVRVRWQFDGCTYQTRSALSGRIHEHARYFYREADVEVLRLDVKKPTHLEAHFYPDGSVRVALTSEISTPRLSLNEARKDKSKFPKCKDDEKPY
jgi:hypothetical protein